MSELEDFLRELGATDDDLTEHAGELPGLASILLIRPGTERLTLREVAERVGTPLEEVTRIWRASGFADPDPDAPVATDAIVPVFQSVRAAQDLFGDEAMLQIARVVGSSMARIADAAISMFLVNLERPLHAVDDVAMEVARANRDGASLIPALSQTMDVLLRFHLLAARRSLLGVQVEGGAETQRLAVGFVDVVGSTVLAQTQTLAEWGSVLTRFEAVAHDIIVRRGARLIKLIGDEVMFASGQPDVAVAVAQELVAAMGADAALPPVRAGLAFGDVVTRDGDCFGPVVNVAARAVKLAEPSQVVVSAELRNALADPSPLVAVGARRAKGIEDPLELWAIAG